MKLSLLLEIIGIGIATLAGLSIIDKQPVAVGIIIAGAACYFAGDKYFKKQGK